MATTHSPETNFGTVTSWLPLTTAFPYQSGCSSAFWARWGITESISYDGVAFDPGYGITVDPASVCMPSQVTLWWETETAPTVNGVATLYSIGPIVCPEAYSTIGSSVVNAESTLVVCCPSGYGFSSLFAAGIVGECTSPVSQGQVVTYVMEKGPFGDLTDGLITTSTAFANDYTVLGVPVNGYNFAISTTSTSSSSSSSSSSTPTTSSPSSTVSPAPKSGNLSTGAIAGIAVSVSLVGIFIIIALLFLLLKRYRRRHEGAANHSVDHKSRGPPIVHELHDMDRPHEVGSFGPRPHELSG